MHNSHFRHEYSASGIDTEFPKWKEDVSRGGIRVSLTDELPEVGVLLNRHFQETPNTSWLRLSRNIDDDYVNVDVLNPRWAHASMGRTALIDTVRIGEGDLYIVGRDKYPELGKYVSSRHVSISAEFSAYSQRVQVKDMGSTNGTGVYLPRTDDQESRNFYEEAYPTQPHSTPSSQEESGGLIFSFIKKHQVGHEFISDVDWSIGFNVITNLKNRYADDKKLLGREFNKALHPDRGTISDARAAHAMYNIARNELGL
jgi:hypothetical protein